MCIKCLNRVDQMRLVVDLKLINIKESRKELSDRQVKDKISRMAKDLNLDVREIKMARSALNQSRVN